MEEAIGNYFQLYKKWQTTISFDRVYKEVEIHLKKNASRYSCVCSSKQKNIYTHLLTIPWTLSIDTIKTKLVEQFDLEIDYGLVHYYPDYTSCIHWHYDKEAMNTPIACIHIGGTRRFCFRHKETKQIYTFDLEHGDLIFMKAGCQSIFEHCVKSIKKYNQPRISITFRQDEGFHCGFVLDKGNIHLYPPSTSQYSITTILEHKIAIGYVEEKDISIRPYLVSEKSRPNHVSLLKSNIQKAIRRQKKEIALYSTLKMIEMDTTVDLLRRLTIITIEDSGMNLYFPKLVWLYVMIQTSSYILSIEDVQFIYNYVGLLCDISTMSHCLEEKDSVVSTREWNTNIYCVALYIRTFYGGFQGERKLIHRYIRALNHGFHIDTTEIKHEPIPIHYKVRILDSAIDFHCYPKMLEKVLANIEHEHLLTTKDIKYYIWTFDSSINTRVSCSYIEKEWNMWKYVIQPKCNVYRYYIRKLVHFS